MLALNLAVAAAGAMVIVNTVVLVQAGLGLGAGELAWTLAAYGLGSMVAALALPRVLERLGDRPVMLAGAVIIVAGLLAGPLAMRDWGLVLPLWMLLGLGNGLVLTPSGRLRRSSEAGDRPALFAAQFALSHACWLLAYPLAGWLGAAAGLAPTFLLLAALAAGGTWLAIRLWPAGRARRAAPPPPRPAGRPPAPHRCAAPARRRLSPRPRSGRRSGARDARRLKRPSSPCPTLPPMRACSPSPSPPRR